MMQANEITPRGLAIALTLLEGDKYEAILPCDYLSNQCGRLGVDKVNDAAMTNNKVIQWTKQTLLHYDGFQQRAAVLKFYIHTAQVTSFPLVSILLAQGVSCADRTILFANPGIAQAA